MNFWSWNFICLLFYSEGKKSFDETVYLIAFFRIFSPSIFCVFLGNIKIRWRLFLFFPCSFFVKISFSFVPWKVRAYEESFSKLTCMSSSYHLKSVAKWIWNWHVYLSTLLQIFSLAFCLSSPSPFPLKRHLLPLLLSLPFFVSQLMNPPLPFISWSFISLFSVSHSLFSTLYPLSLSLDVRPSSSLYPFYFYVTASNLHPPCHLGSRSFNNVSCYQILLPRCCTMGRLYARHHAVIPAASCNNATRVRLVCGARVKFPQTRVEALKRQSAREKHRCQSWTSLKPSHPFHGEVLELCKANSGHPIR